MKFSKLVYFTLLSAITAYNTACVPVNLSEPSPNTENDTYLKMSSLTGFNIKSEGLNDGDPIPGRYIVKFKDNTDSVSLLSKFKANKIGDIKSSLNLQLIEETPGSNLFNNLKNDSHVIYIEQDRVITADGKPTPAPKPTPTATPKPSPTPSPGTGGIVSDPLFSQQYAHSVCKSESGWAISMGSSAVTIAMIDTGIDATHPDLSGKIVPGYSVFSGGNPNNDWNGHGTHTSGIAAAMTNNGIGVAGFAPNAKLMPVQVLDKSGSGSLSGVASGIMYAADHNADVLSMSLGGPSGTLTLQNAVNYALSKGKVVVVAMGNDGTSNPSYPASYKGVMAVAATDSNNVRASWSTYGSNIDISAPGVNILSTMPTYNVTLTSEAGLNYGTLSGTSMATPAVAGLAALLKGYRPTLAGTDIKRIIEQSADDLGAPGFDQYYGYGRINVLKTLSAP